MVAELKLAILEVSWVQNVFFLGIKEMVDWIKSSSWLGQMGLN